MNRGKGLQREFEEFHRTRLPAAREDWWSDCDERVGQMCLRYDEGEEEAEAPEDSLLVEAREALLDSLASLAAIIPGDRWLLGQRIRYLSFLGRWSEAQELVQGCSGGPAWWCPALAGFVQHRSGNTLEALGSFEQALAVMPPPQAHQWRDPSELLEYPSARWIRGGPISPHESLTRFWRLADPLFLTPGNERLAEHYARRFASFLLSDAASTMVIGWNRSRESILVRYGFVARWQRASPRLNELGGGSVVLHWHPESRNLLPPLEALEDPGGVPEGVWSLTETGARSASAPVLAPLIVEGRAQIATLRREEDLLVVAAFGLPTDTVLQEFRGGEGGEIEGETSRRRPPPWALSGEKGSPDTLSGLFLLPEEDASWGPLGVIGTGASGTLQLRGPPGGYLVSMELWNPSGLWGARVRHGIRADAVPLDVPTLSDLIILRPGGDLPETLEEALPRMKPETSLAPGETFTVGWEVYGLGRRREPLTFRLSLVEEEGSLIRRAFKWTGLFNKAPPLVLSWPEAGAAAVGPFFRAVNLDLPSLEPGRYVVRLELDLPNRTTVVSQRRISVS